MQQLSRLVVVGAPDATAVQLPVGGDGVVGPQEVVNVPLLFYLKEFVIARKGKEGEG